MDYFGDYHTHTYFSDGVSSIRQNADAALTAGLKEVAITDHGFLNPKPYSIRQASFDRQTAQIAALQSEYGDKIRILHGVEADILSADGTIDLLPHELSQMDVILLGFHSFAKPKTAKDWFTTYVPSYLSFLGLTSSRTRTRCTDAMISAINKYPVDILAHLNHLYKVDCVEVAAAAKATNTLIELNVKHLNYSDKLFDDMLATGVKFIVNSDAHHCSFVGKFDAAEAFLSRHKDAYDSIVNRGKEPVFPRLKERRA